MQTSPTFIELASGLAINTNYIQEIDFCSKRLYYNNKLNCAIHFSEADSVKLRKILNIVDM